MSTEVRPVGVTCNLRCTYCYEESMREQQRSHKYNREAVIDAINKLAPNEHWSLFGGEALILPIKDIDELLGLAFAKHGHSGIQTNATLITEAHIDLFTKYKTHVGISVDGPDELNDSRDAGTIDATRKRTARSMWAIRELCTRAKTIPHLLPSLIVTIHAGNVSKERFPRFVQWLHELDEMGIRYLNIHTMEMDYKAHTLYLPQEELTARMLDLWNEKFTNLRISKFDEILKLLKGSDNVVCHWKPCDPWNTSAVNGIENDGSPSHCSRTNKDGQNWLPAEGSGVFGKETTFLGHPGTRNFERQMALYVTPQEYGGCKGCEFWLMCYGQCPGEGEKGDWRMRSNHCGTYKALFAEGARRMRDAGETPLCDLPNRLELEQKNFNDWATSTPTYLSKHLKGKQQHGDGHGDSHGDHTDATKR